MRREALLAAELAARDDALRDRDAQIASLEAQLGMAQQAAARQEAAALASEWCTAAGSLLLDPGCVMVVCVGGGGKPTLGW